MTEREAWMPGTGEIGKPDAPGQEPAGHAERARALSLIDFLADDYERRNPPVRDITKGSHFLLEGADLPKVPGVKLTPGMATWLTVDFLDLPPAPLVPADLVPLLETGSAISAALQPAVRAPGDPGHGEPASEDALALAMAAEEWIASVWTPFAARSARIAAARRLHRNLLRQREDLSTDRGSLELVWGFGRLRWATDGIVVDHPLVTMPVEVSHDAGTQRITVSPGGAPQVEARYLAGLTLDDRAAYMSIRQSVDDSGLDLWDEQGLKHVLRQLIWAIDRGGIFAEHATLRPGGAVADGSWALWMRRRQPDYQGFLTQMRELYRDESVAVPGALAAIVSDAPSALPAPGVSAAGEPPLLPLPASEDQRWILDRASRAAGVAVQGPPGTGKSHTIANLISHYAAYGQRVLVVAEKEQALQSLIDKIPQQIRDLTVAVVGEDAASRRELESVIGRIQTRVRRLDPAVTGERIRQLAGELDGIDQEIGATTSALPAARLADMAGLAGTWLAGDAPTRAEVARWVAAHAAAYGYIDDAITPATPPPVDAGELASFTDLIRQVGADRAEACAAVLPELASVPVAEELAARFAQLENLQASVRSVSRVVWDWDRVVAHGAEGLRALAARCQAEREWLARVAGNWPDLVREQAGDRELAHGWESFSTEISRDREEVIRLRAVLAARTVTLPPIIEPGLADGLRQARDRLASSGRFGIFSGPARRAAQECQVDGRLPSSVEDFELCLRAMLLATLRQQMVTHWNSQLGQAGGGYLADSTPEYALGPLLEDLRRALDWPRTWAQLRSDLAATGIKSPDPANPGRLQQLVAICTRCCDQLALNDLSRSVADLERSLQSGAAAPGASPFWGLLADALARQDVPRWQHLRAELADLHEVVPAARLLRELRDRLDVAAPIWTARILADPAAAGDPAELETAWQWRQLDTWISAGPGGPTPSQLRARLEELSGQRRSVVTELVSERAWARLADRLADRERPKLSSYGQAVTRDGMTGGTFAQRGLTDLRVTFEDAKDAIPVWIMPVARALATFRPKAGAPFGVVVVDEADQIGIGALTLLALADKIIVVGNGKEVSPENAGLSRQQVTDLLDEHLAGNSRYRALFDPENSLLDIAFQKFGVVTLTEHFRSQPDAADERPVAADEAPAHEPADNTELPAPEADSGTDELAAAGTTEMPGSGTASGLPGDGPHAVDSWWADLRPATWLDAFPWLAGVVQSASDPWCTEAIGDADEPTRRRHLATVAQLAAERLTRWTFGQIFPGLSPELELLQLQLPTRAARVLERENVVLAADLVGLTLDEFMDWRGVGAGTADTLLQQLADVSASAPTPVVVAPAPAAEGRPASIGGQAAVPLVLAVLGEDLMRVARWYSTVGLPHQALISSRLPLGTPEEVIKARQRIEAISADDLLGEAQLDLDIAGLFEEALGLLEPRAVLILAARFFADESATLDQVGQELGLTRERVRQIEAKARGTLLGVISQGGSLVVVADSVRSLIGSVRPLDDLVAVMPALARTVEEVGQPAWRVLDRLDDAYEIEDGWCVAPSLTAVETATQTELQERADDYGVVRLDEELDLVQSADPARKRELNASWLIHCGYILDGDHVLTRTQNVADYAAAILSIAGKPLSAQEILDRFVIDRSLGSLRYGLSNDDRFERVDRNRWALREWGLDAYAGIRSIIREQVAASGGRVGLDELIEYITGRYTVTASSVAAYASTAPFETKAGVVRLAVGNREIRKTPERTRRLFRHDGAWWYRVRITADHLRGSGSVAPVAIAAIIGLQAGQTRQLDSRLGPQTVAWTGTQPQFSTIRRFLLDRDLAAGTDVFLVIGDDGTFDCEPARELTADPLQDALSLIGAPATADHDAARESLAAAVGLPPATPMTSVIGAYRERGDTDVAELLTGIRRDLEPDEAPRPTVPKAEIDEILDLL